MFGLLRPPLVAGAFDAPSCCVLVAAASSLGWLGTDGTEGTGAAAAAGAFIFRCTSNKALRFDDAALPFVVADCVVDKLFTPWAKSLTSVFGFGRGEAAKLGSGNAGTTFAVATFSV